MVQPLPKVTEKLTGRCRARRGWLGRVVMQVEVMRQGRDPWPRAPVMPQLATESDEAFDRRRAAYGAMAWEPRVLWTDWVWRDARLSDFQLTHGRLDMELDTA